MFISSSQFFVRLLVFYVLLVGHCVHFNGELDQLSCEELTHWKDSNAGRDWGQEEKGTTEDEMAGCHHRLDGCEFE